MSRDLIVLLGALALAERSTTTVGLYEGGERQRHPASPRQRRWMASLYLLFARRAML